MAQSYLDRFPELKSFLQDIEERFLRSQLPADKVILDNTDVIQMLRISKRKLADMRAKREIRFHQSGFHVKNSQNNMPKGKRRCKIYYTLAGVLEFINRNTVNPISKNSKL